MRTRYKPAQQGVIMLIVLVALGVLLAAAVALVRSSDVFQRQSGNLAFRRDLQNQAERGFKTAVTLLSSGYLSTDSLRYTTNTTYNYSAIQLASDDHGIPTALLSDTAFTAAGKTANDITDSDTGVTVRWVIDRQCVSTLEGAAFTTAGCTTISSGTTDSSADSRHKSVNASRMPVYRISVLASGPHNTQLFMQATVVR